ncbi:MAG: hypothetical protein QNK04_19015 [Myxococcota bacterium]|nr:hypothetical protein [Myxococcota bacterium]
MKSASLLYTGLLALALLPGCQTESGPSTQPEKTARPAPPPPSRTFQPGPGITCDRQAKVCRFGETPSPGLTRLHFGDGAAAALTTPPAPDPATGIAPPAQEVADPIFKPSRKQSCDTMVASCYDWDGASVSLTQEHFGAEAAKKLQARLNTRDEAQRIVRYGETITCDNLAQVCYDRMGAGYGLTRLYLGEPQAAALLKRLQASPRS